MIKKILSGFLCLCMLFGSLSIGASAEAALPEAGLYEEQKPTVLQENKLHTVKRDTQTAGSWYTKYGQDGYVMYAHVSANKNIINLPEYVSVDVKPLTAGQKEYGTWQWEKGKDLKKGLPATADDAAERVHGAVFGYPGLLAEIRFDAEKAGGPKGAALYLADEAANIRVTEVQVFEADGVTPYTEKLTVKSFAEGCYLLFNIDRSVVVKMNDVSATGPALKKQNAIINGIFFGTPFEDTAPKPEKKGNIAVDNAAGGTWYTKYGQDGICLYAYNGKGTQLSNVDLLPAYLKQSISSPGSGANHGLWQWQTGDAATLPKGLPLNQETDHVRKHAAAYGLPNLEVSLQFDEKLAGGPKGIALYMADEDRNIRVNKVQVFEKDGVTPYTDEIVLSHFKDGAYIRFNISRDVILRITDASPKAQNGILNGIFAGPVFEDLELPGEPVEDTAPVQLVELVPKPSSVAGTAEPIIGLDTADGQKWEFLFADPNLVRPEANADITQFNWGQKPWESILVPGNIAMQGWDIEENRSPASTPYKNEYYYRTSVNIPADFVGQRILLRFEAVYGGARLWVNGHYVRDHFGSFTTWDSDITDYVTPGEPAEVVLGVVDRFDDPSVGSSYAHCNVAGINRSVQLMAVPKTYLTRVHYVTELDENFVHAELQITAGVHLADAENAVVEYTLLSAEGEKLPLEGSRVIYTKNGSQCVKIPVSSPKLWDAEHPYLYTLITTLSVEGKVLETAEQKVGFREITYKGANGTDPRCVYVNGQEVKLRGTCRHDITWDRGRSTTPEEDYHEILTYKKMNINYIRTSHYPPSQALLDACDELGMYVEEETAVAFQICNLPQRPLRADDSWFINQFAEMVERDKSHPSVLIWSLGNESHWSSIASADIKMYDYIMANDTTRPHKLSYTERIPESERYRSDFWSTHYKHNGWQTGMKIPVIHDEYAHVSCYNVSELQRDLGVRNWWGENVDRLWNEIYTTDGMLGGALWGGIDDVFFIPEGVRERYQSHSYGTATGYGEWGSVMDVYHRLKPEAWLVKKTYSPVAVDTKSLKRNSDGSLTVDVENRYFHSNLNEITLKWSTASASGSMLLPDIAPWEKGSFNLPARQWKTEEPILIEFYSNQGPVGSMLVDTYRLELGEKYVPITEAPAQAPKAEEAGNLLTVTGERVCIVFDKTQGQILSAALDGEVLLSGGPHLHVLGMNLDAWQAESFSYQTEGNAVVVTINGAYGEIKVQYVLHITSDGLIDTDYEIVSQPSAKGGLAERGISFDVRGDVESVSWLKDGFHSVYPDTHIGRLSGQAFRLRKGCEQAPDLYGQMPSWGWQEDMTDFFLFSKDHHHQYKVTNDFNTMRDRVWIYDVEYPNTNGSIRVESNGREAVRMMYSETIIGYIDDHSPEVVYTPAWTPDSGTGYMGTIHWTGNQGAAARYTFTGTGVEVLGNAQFNTSYADVTLFDAEGNQLQQIRDIDTYSEQPQSKVVAVFKDLPFGTYTVEYKATGKPHPVHGQSFLALDGFHVLNTYEEPTSERKLIINNDWSYTARYGGNYNKPAAELRQGMKDSVRIRLTDAEIPADFSYRAKKADIHFVEIMGEPGVGNELKAEAALTVGELPELTYRWYRCEFAGNAEPIAIADTAVYRVQPADYGKKLFCRVSANGKTVDSHQLAIGIEVVDGADRNRLVYSKADNLIFDAHKGFTKMMYDDTMTYVRGGEVSFRFTGTGFSWWSYREVNFTKVDVYVDGKHVATVDTHEDYDSNDPRIHSEPVYTLLGLENGEHTVRLVVPGAGGDAKGYMGIDAMVIMPVSHYETVKVIGANGLPGQITAYYGENSAKYDVTWEQVPQEPGTYTVNGTVSGTGDTVQAEVTVEKSPAQKVVEQIRAIGAVENTPECAAAIQAAREAFDALTSADQELVRNYEGHDYLADLEAAEAAIAAMKLNIFGTNMTLGNELAINFMVKKSNVQDLTGLSMQITKHFADREDVVVTVPAEQWVSYNEYYKITFDDISAKEMTDEITAVILRDGKPAGKVYTDSVERYALRILRKQETKAELKSVIVDMLNYGTEAQKYFKYNEAVLANAQLTDAEKALASKPIETQNIQVKGPKCIGSNLNLGNNMALTMFFKGITPDMHAAISYTKHTDEEKTITVSGADFVKFNDTVYGVRANTLVVADAQQPVTVTVYDADNNVVASGTDSIASYVTRGNLGELGQAILKFAASAEVYFSNR